MTDRDMLEKLSGGGEEEPPRDILARKLEGEGCPARIGDPYRFCVGGTTVHISFRDSGRTLEEKLRSYFLERKRRGGEGGCGPDTEIG